MTTISSRHVWLSCYNGLYNGFVSFYFFFCLFSLVLWSPSIFVVVSCMCSLLDDCLFRCVFVSVNCVMCLSASVRVNGRCSHRIVNTIVNIRNWKLWCVHLKWHIYIHISSSEVKVKLFSAGRHETTKQQQLIEFDFSTFAIFIFLSFSFFCTSFLFMTKRKKNVK